jgi:predicted MFS family arabinose efflux permease
LGAAALIYGITRGGEEGWKQGQTIAALVTGTVGLGIFIWLQAGNRHALLPLRLFASSSRSAAYAARMLFIAAMRGFFFLTTQRMQDEMGLTATIAGFGFLPMTVMTFLSSLCIPALTKRLGNGRLAALAFALLALGLSGLALADPNKGYIMCMGLPLLILGTGNGLGLGPLTVAGVHGVAAEDAGAAGGVVNTVHQFGGSLGVAASAAVATAMGIPAGLMAGSLASLVGMAISLIFIIRTQDKQSSSQV